MAWLNTTFFSVLSFINAKRFRVISKQLPSISSIAKNNMERIAMVPTSPANVTILKLQVNNQGCDTHLSSHMTFNLMLPHLCHNSLLTTPAPNALQRSIRDITLLTANLICWRPVPQQHKAKLKQVIQIRGCDIFWRIDWYLISLVPRPPRCWLAHQPVGC